MKTRLQTKNNGKPTRDLDTEQQQHSGNIENTNNMDVFRESEKTTNIVITRKLPLSKFIPYSEVARNVITSISTSICCNFFSDDYTKKTRTYLLHGPSGNGKSSIIEYICSMFQTRYKIAYYSLTPSNLKSKYYGQTEQTLNNISRRLFEECSKGILVFLFIDEIDYMISDRACTDEHWMSLRSEWINFLNKLDKLQEGNFVLFGCTNMAQEKMDAAIARRFVHKTFIPNPLPAEIREFLEATCRDILEIDDMDNIVNLFIGKSFSQINNIIKNTINTYVNPKLSVTDFSCPKKVLKSARGAAQEMLAIKINCEMIKRGMTFF